MAHHDEPTTRRYVEIFVILLALLVLTCAAAFVDLDRILHGRFWSLGFALAVAIAKAVLIMLFFMHVKFGPRPVWVFAGAGFLWLGIMLALTFGDYVTRNRPPGESPKGEPRYLVSTTPP